MGKTSLSKSAVIDNGDKSTKVSMWVSVWKNVPCLFWKQGEGKEHLIKIREPGMKSIIQRMESVYSGSVNDVKLTQDSRFPITLILEEEEEGETFSLICGGKFADPPYKTPLASITLTRKGVESVITEMKRLRRVLKALICQETEKEVEVETQKPEVELKLTPKKLLSKRSKTAEANEGRKKKKKLVAVRDTDDSIPRTTVVADGTPPTTVVVDSTTAATMPPTPTSYLYQLRRDPVMPQIHSQFMGEPFHQNMQMTINAIPPVQQQQQLDQLQQGYNIYPSAQTAPAEFQLDDLLEQPPTLQRQDEIF